MAPNHRPFLLTTAFFPLFTAIAASPPPPQPPSPSPSSPPPPPPLSPPPPSPPSPTATPLQLNNIMDALIGAGDFGNWINIIIGANPLRLPLSATLFIPQDGALTALPTAVDPLIFPYHVVPQRLTFSDLQLFKPFSRLPTLLPGKSIIITNPSAANFTVDDAPLTQPDLYVTATMAVHGVGAVLEYSVYGNGLDFLPGSNSEQGQQLQKPPPSGSPAPPGMVLPAGEIGGIGWRSDAAPPCHCVEFPVGWFLVACALFVFKIHRKLSS